MKINMLVKQREYAELEFKRCDFFACSFPVTTTWSTNNPLSVMLPTESLQDAFLFLSRDDLDAIQLVSSMLNSVVANLPGDSPVRHIACLYPTTGPDGSLQVDLDRDERDADLTVLTVECKDTSLFVRNASVANVSFGALVGIYTAVRIYISCSMCRLQRETRFTLRHRLFLRHGN